MGNKKIMGLFIVGLLLIGGFVGASNVFGLSYSSDIGVSFTFNPTLKIVLSATGCGSTESEAKLCISNLSPGTASDSNILTVKILNNTGNGYTLNATVGSDTLEGGKFNTRDLVHSNSSITSSFASIATNATIATNTDLTDNTWGYSFMDETLSNPTWSSYRGLPLYSDTTPATLKTSLNPATSADGDILKFKIAAKSATMLPSGEYNNVINFTVTAQPIPVTLSMAYENAGKEKLNGYFKLQDMTPEICNATEVLDEGSQTQLIDVRDNKVYWATKLQDGHCWMTQNLDLNLDSSVALTSDTTDLNTVSSWTPVRSTINAATDANTSGSITGWTNDYNTPYSVDAGDYYWKNLPFYPSTNCYPNSNYQYCSYIVKGTTGAGWSTYFSTTPYGSNGTHGHVGNKYNWSAAIATNDTSGITTNTYNNIASNPQNSICPKGWRLPTISGQTPAYTEANSPNEFARLAYLYDNYTGNTSISSEGLEKAPLYMTRSGHVNSGALYYAGGNELYWSSTVSSSTHARNPGFDSTVVYPEDENYRYLGFSLRCLAR